jgi:transposase
MGQEWCFRRSRGGPNTKIHAPVDALGNPMELAPSPGQAGDLTRAEPLIENSGFGGSDRRQGL